MIVWIKDQGPASLVIGLIFYFCFSMFLTVLGEHMSDLDAQLARGTSFDESPYSSNVFSSRSTPSPGVVAIKVVMEFSAHGETE